MQNITLGKEVLYHYSLLLSVISANINITIVFRAKCEKRLNQIGAAHDGWKEEKIGKHGRSCTKLIYVTRNFQMGKTEYLNTDNTTVNRATRGTTTGTRQSRRRWRARASNNRRQHNKNLNIKKPVPA